jgi:hypothetical protein
MTIPDVNEYFFFIIRKSVIWMRHESFMFARNFFIDHLSPVSLLLPNEHGDITLEGREIKFTWEERTLFLKESFFYRQNLGCFIINHTPAVRA